MLKTLPKMLLELIFPNFLPIMLFIVPVLCFNMNNIDVRILLLVNVLLEYLRYEHMSVLFYLAIYEYNCILNVLLECI